MRVPTLVMRCCISYYSYIKPQHKITSYGTWWVVYRTIPTSNHNTFSTYFVAVIVVYRTIPTSNHNQSKIYAHTIELYIVLFLHQTTTVGVIRDILASCISYYSYIKPQLVITRQDSGTVVYRTIPTSNHNCRQSRPLCLLLYIVLFLHQTTTLLRFCNNRFQLYIVLFLHQTTTSKLMHLVMMLLYIVLFLHQTTTSNTQDSLSLCCISYYSYIKPQRSSFSVTR